MGLFESYLLTEAGLTPADKAAVNNLTRQIQTIDKQILSKVGPAGKGTLMQQTGDAAGHINDQDPFYKTLVARRAMLVAKRMKITGKSEQ